MARPTVRAVDPHGAEPAADEQTAPAATALPEGCRVLLVAPQPLFRFSGTPINIMMMCRALGGQGLKVDVAALPGGQDVPLPGVVLRRVPRLPLSNTVPVGFSMRKLVYNGLLALMVLRLLARGGYHVVHAVEEAAFYAIPLGRLFRLPTLIDLDSDLVLQLRDHGSWPARMLAAPAGWLRRIALHVATGALTVSPHISRLARAESPGTPVFEISDVPIEEAMRRPDPERMAAYRAEIGLERRRLAVYTGNCDRRQGLDELIRAMPEVLRYHPDAALLIVGGEPPELRRLQRLVDQLRVIEAVRLIGRRPPPTMPEYMGMAEILVSPRRERYVTPLKIFSYMASGQPIVATDLPTHTVVLDEECAILVPPSAEGLAAGILRALDDPEAARRLGRRAARLVEERYSYERFRRQLLQAYEAIHDCRPRSDGRARRPA
jgi:glycosyltransferase involved in cell wall biosynthesis